MHITIGSDHAGVKLKAALAAHLQSLGHEVKTVGAKSSVEDDIFAHFADVVVHEVKQNKTDLGVLICGSGIGISIRANRHKGIRAALVHNEFTAKSSKAHTNANIICFGERVIDENVAKKCMDIFLSEEYEGGRHVKRLAALDEPC